jgi:hypothetical protein
VSHPLTSAVSVFNYGAFRPIAELETTGEARFVLGPGTYLVTAGDDTTGFWNLTRVIPDSTVEVEAAPERPTAPSGFFWLRGAS